jgi:hypothetical protein
MNFTESSQLTSNLCPSPVFRLKWPGPAGPSQEHICVAPPTSPANPKHKSPPWLPISKSKGKKDWWGFCLATQGHFPLMLVLKFLPGPGSYLWSPAGTYASSGLCTSGFVYCSKHAATSPTSHPSMMTISTFNTHHSQPSSPMALVSLLHSFAPRQHTHAHKHPETFSCPVCHTLGQI